MWQLVYFSPNKTLFVWTTLRLILSTGHQPVYVSFRPFIYPCKRRGKKPCPASLPGCKEAVKTLYWGRSGVLGYTGIHVHFMEIRLTWLSQTFWPDSLYFIKGPLCKRGYCWVSFQTHQILTLWVCRSGQSPPQSINIWWVGIKKLKHYLDLVAGYLSSVDFGAYLSSILLTTSSSNLSSMEDISKPEYLPSTKLTYFAIYRGHYGLFNDTRDVLIL